MLTDTEARKIASEWHGGQSSALYAFVSTGAIRGEHSAEWHYNDAYRETIGNLSEDMLDPNDGALLDLATYLEFHGPRGPQPGWSNLTW